MSSYVCLTVRFLQPYYHGRADGGEPEWPPSPLRLFQALVAAAGRRQETPFNDRATTALCWLESKPCPHIVAPVGIPSDSKYRLYVPDNVADKAAKSWSKGTEASMAGYRTEKDMQPVRLSGDAVHYLYLLATQEEPPLETLRGMAQSITHLGLGIDMAAGNATVVSEEEAAELAGEHWLPVGGAASSTALRVPMESTLDDLTRRHNAFLNRICRDDRGNESFNPMPPLSAFRVIGYRRATDPPQRRFAAFALLKPDASGYRAFDTARKGLAVAGMMRCATKNAATRARPDDARWIDSFVLGHGEDRGEMHQPVGPQRFAYIPLPSIEFRGEGRANVVGSIRRILVTVLADGHQQEIDWAGRALSGEDLIDKQTEQPQATLSRLATSEKRVQRYIQSASIWATVTPVVLPGYDDPSHYRRRLRNNCDAENQRRWLGKLDGRTDYLIRKAIGQAGFSDTLKRHAIIEWRATGYWPGTELASHYGVPNHLQKFSRYHVRIQWRDANGQPIQVFGPICIGGGRFYGLGLFAGQDRGP